MSKILIVDDSKAAISRMEELLKPLSVEITIASNGMEGFERAKEKDFDLVITDAVMPVVDGFELTRNLKGLEKTRPVPVIIISDFDTKENIENGFSSGASAFLSKSEAETRFLPLVQHALEKSSLYRKKTILLIDDSMSVCFILSHGLNSSGFETMCAGDGAEALDLIRKKTPDIIVCDIEMPVLDGYSFRKHLLSNPEYAKIPFIVMSGRGERHYIKSFANLKASAYLVKPFNVEELVIIIERFFLDQLQMLLREHDQMLEAITSLASALDARDPYTHGHSESVARIVGEMVRESGADSNEIEAAILGGMLHDIGKIGIPDRILQKPGALTDEEFSIIKEHPLIGEKILKPLESLKNTINIVKFHHEKLDGSGYPSGLKGSQIPLLGRMTAVADIFDALIGDRPYREGMPRSRAFQIIEDQKGKQLCPESVDLFFKII